LSNFVNALQSGAGLGVKSCNPAIKTKMKLRDRSLAPPRNFFTPGARPVHCMYTDGEVATPKP
jgi:hypothetical protein